ncbi:LicD family protein [Sphingobacterium siyangense]|jgi:phosphorylcholine metabolism protein LicD|uniref:LicD family protein n=1 Tax=Sphingobacterium siyangense TaxID=459529 RepID=UPI0028ABA930|nr:LicD family protein [Sphingobacterium siyangense]
MIFPLDERASKTDLKDQVHTVILRILKIIDIICKENDIGYWLDYGTLLGAIRHRGFIPWDYEADIGMIRTDYDRFVKIVREVLPEDLFFQSKETDPYFMTYGIIEGKFRDRYSDYVDYYRTHPNLLWHNGIQVDIFVYDLDISRNECISNSFERYYSNGRIHLTFEEIGYIIDKEFEGHKFPVPIGYDTYLKRAYGNYLEFPPKDQQKFPNINVFTPCKHIEARAWK